MPNTNFFSGNLHFKLVFLTLFIVIIKKVAAQQVVLTFDPCEALDIDTPCSFDGQVNGTNISGTYAVTQGGADRPSTYVTNALMNCMRNIISPTIQDAVDATPNALEGPLEACNTPNNVVVENARGVLLLANFFTVSLCNTFNQLLEQAFSQECNEPNLTQEYGSQIINVVSIITYSALAIGLLAVAFCLFYCLSRCLHPEKSCDNITDDYCEALCRPRSSW